MPPKINFFESPVIIDNALETVTVEAAEYAWSANRRDMTVSANKAAARSYFDLVLNQGEMAQADRIFARGVQVHYPLGDLDGIGALKQYIMAARGAFPDIRFTISDLVGEAAQIAARWSLSGTQTRLFKGQSPSGAKVEVPGITLFHFADGKICEMWVSFNPALLRGK